MHHPDLKKTIIQQAQNTINATLAPEPAALMEQYAGLVLEWNQKINLISRQNAEKTVSGHIVDSLAVLPLLDLAATTGQVPMSVLDLGSGGGFPGIPVKICRPGINLTCVEATQKKAKFLDLAARELGLQNVTVIPKHSQELIKDGQQRNKYDIVMCRAVAELKELVPIASFFLRAGGKLMAHKAQKAELEIRGAEKEMARGDMRVSNIIEYTLDGKIRQILELEKQKA